MSLSAQNWFASTIFERYWTKPSKKKEKMMDMTKNPPKESMSMLGTCIIAIEPHIFEAKLYTIKDLGPIPVKTEAFQASGSTSDSPVVHRGAVSAGPVSTPRTQSPPHATPWTSPQALLHSTHEAPPQAPVSSQTPVSLQDLVPSQAPT